LCIAQGNDDTFFVSQGVTAVQMGIPTEQAEQLIDTVYAGYETQAREAIERSGFSADEVVTWAQKNAPRELGEAIRRQCSSDSTGGYAMRCLGLPWRRGCGAEGATRQGHRDPARG
jgi:hypothetical protein